MSLLQARLGTPGSGMQRLPEHCRFQPSLLLPSPGGDGDGLACVAGAVALL
jgi:hypothetical protein